MTTDDSHIGSHSQHRLSDQVSANTGHDNRSATGARRRKPSEPIQIIALQTRTVRSLALDTNSRPSGLKVTSFTAPLWPLNRRRSRPLLISKSRTAASKLPPTAIVNGVLRSSGIGFQVRVFSALNVGLTCRLGSLSPINFFGKRWSDGSVQVLNWIALNS